MGNYIAALVALVLIILACAIWQNGIAQKMKIDATAG